MKILQGTLRKGRPMDSSTGKGQMHKFYTRAAAMALAVSGAAVAANGQAVPASGFFDWEIGNNPTADFPNYNPSPFLSDAPSDIANARARLAEAQANGFGNNLAVKVISPLQSAEARNVFNEFPIRYVFADFEGPDRVGRTRAIADLVLASAKSKNAFVGNFNIYPNASGDQTRPANTNPDDVADSFEERPESFMYNDQRGRRGNTFGQRMANPALYPGSPDFKSRAQGNAPSGTPNLRSSFFTEPIKRLTTAKNALPSGDRLIPWVTRFNNWGNPALDSDGDSSNGYDFVTDNQLLSRGDFSALVLHYRLRGAHSYHLFSTIRGSVLGYSQDQERFDAASGWGQSSTANGIFSRGNFAFANLTNLVGDQGGDSGDTNRRDIERAGAVWSGVYDRTGGNNRRLVVLFSNLSNVRKTIDLPNSIGGFATFRNDSSQKMDDFFLDPGQHRIATFRLQGNRWILQSNGLFFPDQDRSGVGVPEPTGLALVGIGAMGLLARRRRRVTA